MKWLQMSLFLVLEVQHQDSSRVRLEGVLQRVGVSNLKRALLGRDLVGRVQRVLVVETVTRNNDSCALLGADTLQVNRDRLLILFAVDHLDVDLILFLVRTGDPIQGLIVNIISVDLEDGVGAIFAVHLEDIVEGSAVHSLGVEVNHVY